MRNGGLFMGARYVVAGGRPLGGEVRVPAAKNSVLPLLAATLLCGGEARLRGVPRLSDVECGLALLQSVGCQARRWGADVVVSGGAMRCALGPQAANMRASILFCAPLLAKLGRAETCLPGGCRIGARPIDLHLAGLKQMGVCEQPAAGGTLVLCAPRGLRGADITLRFPSVGATETLLLAAACAKGETVLRGAAREPEIVDLAQFINLCGGCVQGAGSAVVRVSGRRALTGCEFKPVPDRIFAATMACAAACAGGCVEISGCAPQLYAPVLDILEQAGCAVRRSGSGAVVARYGELSGVGRVFTGVYPALATDAAPLLAAALLGARGCSVIEDVVFESRFGCAGGFARMGAQTRAEGRVLHIMGVRELHGAHVRAPDLRGGAALVLAALAAQGRSRIEDDGFIGRGYAEIDTNLAALGAQIGREEP